MSVSEITDDHLVLFDLVTTFERAEGGDEECFGLRTPYVNRLTWQHIHLKLRQNSKGDSLVLVETASVSQMFLNIVRFDNQ
jgi:hypothetical protein